MAGEGGDQKQRRPEGRLCSLLNFAYLTTTCWNSGEVSSPANWLSDDEYSTVKVPDSESIVVSSIALFSTGDPEVRFRMATPFISVAAVAAVIVSDITTAMSNFTPFEKSMV